MIMARKINHKYVTILPTNKSGSKYSVVQKTIITVIILAVITTLVALIVSIFLKPERLAKSRIESMAKDYYENFIYEGLINSKNYSGDLESTMKKYTEIGLTPITLRQLILHNPEKTAKFAESLRESCDIERTTVKYYPKAPFSRSDYLVDYHYICNF